jgi:hypothetical protein
VIELVELSMMGAKDLLEGRCQILEQMKAVGNLRGCGGPLPNACGIGFGAVPDDNRDVGMGVKPRGHGFGRPILEDVNGAPPLEIDNEGAVTMAFAPRPVVDANDGRFSPPGQRHTTHTPKQGVTTPWEPMARQVPRAGSTA